MRRFCRNVDIKDTEFIKRCTRLWLDEKKGRNDVQRFLAHYAGLTYRAVHEAIECDDYWFLDGALDAIAADVSTRFQNRKLDLPPIQYKQRYDEHCQKWRTLGIQKPIHQIMDYVAVEGCKELFNAKIGPYQMASLPGRGQEKGVKVILKWLQVDEKHTRDYVQADIHRCYPSIDHDCLKQLFSRDLKNPDLFWLVCELIDTFPEGLSIGSYFSQYACNYYLSKAYHYASEQLYKVRKKRNGEVQRTRLVYHILFYMDDILLLGSAKKDVEKALEMLSEFLRTEMKLELKPNYKAGKVDYIGKDGKHHGSYIDMMGYRIYRDHVTVRRRSYKRIRRTLIRANVRLMYQGTIPLEMARRIISHAGKLEHSNSYHASQKYNLQKVKNVAEHIVSCHDKQMAEEKKRRKQEYENRKRALPDKTGRTPVQSSELQSGGSLAAEEYRTADSAPF